MPLPVVTPMTVDDLDAIMALERVCFKDPWTRRMYLADLTQNELATYLAIRLPIAIADCRITRHSSLAIVNPRLRRLLADGGRGAHRHDRLASRIGEAAAWGST